MIYLGSKARIVGEILPIMLQSIHPGQAFVDAFCGGCNVVQHVPQEYKRIANDNNRYLIAMWKTITTTNWNPSTAISKAYYNKVRESWHKMPGDYSCVWEKSITNNLNPTKTYTAVEKLWMV